MSDDIDDTIPPSEPSGPKGIAPIAIEDELKRSYLDYAMSVIVSRALPDARDGLKPVHRRILWSMHENGFTHDKPYRKSARIVGDVMGKYHPHGDSAIYDALVRMAQDFSMSLPLIDGQGNFGSMDGDPPAAMRYTESRLAKPTADLLADIEKKTVDFQANYDGSENEPSVLPARFPNLLVNGAAGIAVGMATNIPPHNLGEVIDAAVAMIDDPAVSDIDLISLIPGPDFPTGALIIGRSAARNALLTGRGSVVMRAKTSIEEIRRDREAIIITEIPYQVNKATMIEKIADLVREKRIEGIAELRDESDRKGVRVVVELKRDATADVVLNQLYRFTPLQTSFGVNMLALDSGRPKMMGLRPLLEIFIAFREEVVTRRTKFELSKARDRGHIIVGLALAVANIDEIIRIIRESRDPAEAREGLMSRSWPAMDTAPLIALIADPRSAIQEDGTIRMTEEQARAILDLRLQRLTGLAREELAKEAQEIAETIQRLLTILASRELIRGIIREELLEVKTAFAKPRRTEIIEADLEIDDESLIAREDMVVTVTHGGYVKRTTLATYRTQRRGGKGRSGMGTKEEDFITRLFVANTHQPVLFFSSNGMVYKEKIWRLPEGAPQSKGKALVNMLPLEKGETITSIMALPEDEALWETLDVMFATKSGGVRRNKLSDFVQVNRNGKIAMKPDEGDSIVDVQMCTEHDDILLATGRAMCIRFPVPEVRVFQGRTSTGVRGIALAEGDEVIGMSVLRHVDAEPAETRAYLRHAAAMRRAIGDEVGDAAPEPAEAEEVEGGEAALTPERIAELGGREQFVLTISDRGFGKRASAYEYRVTGRGGKGIVAHRMSDANARLAGSFPVEDEDELLLVSDAGQLIRCPISEIRIAARATQGVTLIRIDEGERVVAVERLIDLNGDRE
ncbi:MAG: DNA gyrase subunit A [Caulobacterales bacterium]